VVAALVRMHLISMLDVNELLRSTNRSYQIARGSPKDTMQLNLVFEEEAEGEVTLKFETMTPCL
jgi:hypothetical protein